MDETFPSNAPDDAEQQPHQDNRDDEGRLDEATALMQAEALLNDPKFTDAINNRFEASQQLNEAKPQFEAIREEYEPVEQDYEDRLKPIDENLNNVQRSIRSSIKDGYGYPYQGYAHRERELGDERRAIVEEMGADEFYTAGEGLKRQISMLENQVEQQRQVAKQAELEALYDARPGWTAMYERQKDAIYAWQLFSEVHDANPDIIQMPVGEYFDRAKKIWPVKRKTQEVVSWSTWPRKSAEILKQIRAGETIEDKNVASMHSLKLKSPGDVFSMVAGYPRANYRDATGAGWIDESQVDESKFDFGQEREKFLDSITNETTIDQIYGMLIDVAERVAAIKEEIAKPHQERLKAEKQKLYDWHPPGNTPSAREETQAA
jgi:hypothetical protein